MVPLALSHSYLACWSHGCLPHPNPLKIVRPENTLMARAHFQYPSRSPLRVLVLRVIPSELRDPRFDRLRVRGVSLLRRWTRWYDPVPSVTPCVIFHRSHCFVSRECILELMPPASVGVDRMTFEAVASTCITKTGSTTSWDITSSGD